MWAFDLVDIERFERNHPEYKPEEDPEPLDDRGKRKLGQLEKEKIIWDMSLKGAIHIGIFISKQKDFSVTRNMVMDELHKHKPDIPSTSVERIINAIPDKYRKLPGRPKKDSKNKN